MRFFFIITALLLLCALTGCGGKDPDPVPPGPLPDQNTSDETETAEPVRSTAAETGETAGTEGTEAVTAAPTATAAPAETVPGTAPSRTGSTGGGGAETHPQTDPTEAPTEPEEPPEVYLTDIHRLRGEAPYIAVAEEVFTFRSEDVAHFVIQGACFDGTYWYAAAVAQPEGAPELTRIIKMDLQGQKLAESDPLPLDHANNLTYNSKLGLLVVTHCSSEDGHYYRYSTVDPATFEIKHTADLPYPFFAMAYSPELDRYASGEWGGGTLDTWDGDLNPLLHREVEAPGSLSQGVFCDAEGIYFVRSSQNGFPSEIRIYNWRLSLERTVPIALSGGIEPENINLVDGRVYIVANDWTRRCGVLYALTFT